MKRISNDAVINHFKSQQIIDLANLTSFIQSQIPDISEATLSWYIHQLHKQNIIKRIGRGQYTINSNQDFTPEIPKKLENLYKKVKKEFPAILFCIWDTNWLNSFANLQQINKQIIIEVEHEATEAVFLKLKQTEKNIYFNPTSEIVDLYISANPNSIIVKNLNSQSPLKTIHSVTIPELEKILVDCLTDSNIFAAWNDEIENIYQTAFMRFNVNTSKLKRYAKRRYREKEVSEMIYKILSK